MIFNCTFVGSGSCHFTSKNDVVSILIKSPSYENHSLSFFIGFHLYTYNLPSASLATHIITFIIISSFWFVISEYLCDLSFCHEQSSFDRTKSILLIFL